MPSRQTSLIRLRRLCDRVSREEFIDDRSNSETLLESIESEFQSYRECYENDLEDPEDSQFQDEFDEIDDKVLAAKAKLKKILAKVSAETTSVTSTESTFQELLVHQKQLFETMSSNARKSSTALPKIVLPQFSGKSHEWIAFRDMFVSTIHNNKDLSNIQRLQHLRNSVTGDAESIIRTIPITDNNYSIAWQSMLDAFNDDYQIVESIFKRFLTTTSKVGLDNQTTIKSKYNVFRETFEMLRNEGEYALTLDPFVIFLMSKSLDTETAFEWSKFSKRLKQPKIEDFLSFLGDYCKIVERSKTPQTSFSNRVSKNSNAPTKPNQSFGNKHIRNNALTTFSCMFCAGEHSIYKCKSFLELSISDRESFLVKQSRCLNCFSKDHAVGKCKSTHNCNLCHKKHNTLIHSDKKPNAPSSTSPVASQDSTTVTLVNSHLSENSIHNYSHESNILPTIQIRARSVDGTFHVLRGLVDSGSQATLISERCVNKLGLKRKFSRLPISSVANTGKSITRGCVELEFTAANVDSKSFRVSAHVTPLKGLLPQTQIQVSCLQEIKSFLSLADDQFYLPSEVDLIFSASFFAIILKSLKYHCNQDKLYFVETHFGYVACSGADINSSLSINSSTFDPSDSLEFSLENFWAIEDVPSCTKTEKPSDQECEKIFLSSTSRLQSGRFCVRLPFRKPPMTLGSTKSIALRRFFSLEKRFSNDSEFHSDYKKFMSEYEQLGHMTKSNFTLDSLPLHHYIIPHHGIYQRGPGGSKLRVVFDASAKSSSGFSLNDVIHTGPRLQNEITSVLNKFRTFKFVLTADIVKMYRQINIHENDRDFQLIIWRHDLDSPIKIYSMNTVTYGEACSPYLSLRVLQQLVEQDGDKFPDASKILLKNRYVDDLLFGHDDLNQLTQLRRQVVNLLKKGCFELKKWTSNHPSLIKDLQNEELANPLIFSSDNDAVIKTLGIVWMPSNDQFTFHHNLHPLQDHTKRTMLSESAKIFDPLGWIAPVVVSFKALFQETWIQKLSWDEILPPLLKRRWLSLRDELPQLDQIRITRYFGANSFELHGFADASQTAYAAVIYARVVTPNGQILLNLVTAKTKLAPIKQLSIPRLELCAAHLLAKLIRRLLSDFDMQVTVHLWSDSTTVLSWIKSLPREWNSFVANRVGMIHELCPSIQWYYVKSSENPADIASRGCSPSQLLKSKIWWNGPSFLADSAFQLPCASSFETKEEKRSVKVNIVQVNFESVLDIINRFSNFNRLIRTFAYVYRFLNVTRRSEHNHSVELTAFEVQHSTVTLIKLIQKHFFSSEIVRLKENRPLPKSSVIKCLNPVFDEDGLIRVRGRIYVNASSDNIPILLPNCHFSELLIRKTHHETYHGGIKLMCSNIQEKYWIISLNRIVKRVYRSCKSCVRYRGQTYNPPMGQLPTSRITPSKPFSVTGIDFAGPVSLRPTLRRGKGTQKGYIAVFVCFSTKAMHLELVMGLSTNHLICALHRFVSRRGTVNKIISDNGRNFVGVNRAMKEYRKTITDSINSSDLANFLATRLITWQFIPPYSPHFGGLWEAGVKSVKVHLTRTFHGAIMTIEELQTALCRIESILNSRPLNPISFTDQNIPITPSHLLTGYPSQSLPSSLTASVAPQSSQRRMEAISNTVRSFWKRWRNEYLPILMKKSKWCSLTSPGPSIGDIVLVKRSSDPPQFWPLAKIVNVFPGADKIVRVVDVETVDGRRRESTRNLVPLNVEADASTPGSMSA